MSLSMAEVQKFGYSYSLRVHAMPYVCHIHTCTTEIRWKQMQTAGVAKGFSSGSKNGQEIHVIIHEPILSCQILQDGF